MADMTDVVFWRGGTQELKAQPIIDGQLLYDTETGETFMDVGSERKPIGDGKNKLPAIGENDDGKIVVVDGKEYKLKAPDKTTEIPEYAIAEANRVVKKVQQNRSAKSLILSAMTDFHLTASNDPNTDATLQATELAGWGLAEIEKQIALDGKLFLGDYTNGPKNYTVQKVIDDILYARKAVKRTPDEFWVRGNHDLSYPSGRDRMMTPNEIYANIDANSLECKTDWSNPGGGYCYHDFDKQRIRLIMLNTCDVYDERAIPSTSENAPSEWISIKQAKWVGDHALDFSDKKEPATWGVVFAGHHPINYAFPVFSKFIKMLEDYRDRKSGSISYSADTGAKEYKYDFTMRQTARILCALNGHSHNFRTDYVSSGDAVPKWLLRATVPQVMAGRYNEAATSSLESFRNKYGEFGNDGLPVYYRKIPGTKDGTSFYICNIDREHNVLDCTCYGAGHDIKLPFTPSTIVYEITNNLTNCTTDNKASSIGGGTNYVAQITADAGYKLSVVKVTMGGTDITAESYEGGIIRIPNVTGNIVITAIAVGAPKFTNLIPISLEDNLRDVYNGTGFKENTYVSSGVVRPRSGVATTGLMPYSFYEDEIPTVAQLGDYIVYLKNISGYTNINTNARIAFYGEGLKWAGEYGAQQLITEEEWNPQTGGIVKYTDSSGIITKIDISSAVRYFAQSSANNPAKYIRFCSPGINDTSVITMNEPID